MEIIFFSEGNQHTRFFENVLNLAISKNFKVTLITLDKDDVLIKNKLISNIVIPKNNIEKINTLNNLSGDIFITTTPGIGQPLEHKFQYLKSINRDLNVKYTEKDELMSISGKLIEVSDDFLKVKMKKDIFKLNFDQILSAKVKIAFK